MNLIRTELEQMHNNFENIAGGKCSQSENEFDAQALTKMQVKRRWLYMMQFLDCLILVIQS